MYLSRPPSEESLRVLVDSQVTDVFGGLEDIEAGYN